jgi:hypothetical protein
MNEETLVLQQWLTSNLIDLQEEDIKQIKNPLLIRFNINEMILDRNSTHEKENTSEEDFNSFQKLSVDLPIQDSIIYSNPFKIIPYNESCIDKFVLNQTLNSPYSVTHPSKMKKEVYNCHFPDCLMDFRHKWLLERHLESHSTFCFFKCTENNCHKSYKSKENLLLHIINVHRHEKPFKCKHCNMKFSHRNGT